ncbi:MAG: hypothetical protein IIC67_12575, partial [Thaumarchaeota archaeon]|nr:hypothetical protein [Nitrososphaerota archaeon]
MKLFESIINSIPCKVVGKEVVEREFIIDPLVCGIEVVPEGEDYFYGFELSGD